MLPFLDLLGPIIEKALSFIPDPKMKAEAQQKMTEELNRHSEELLKALSAVDTAQAAINTEEAKSSNIFISGWRPAVAWTCTMAFMWAYVLQPIVVFLCVLFNHPLIQLPRIDMSEMMPVLLGVLGLGGMRSWEKSQGIADKH